MTTSRLAVLAVVLTLSGCKKKEEAVVEPPKPEVVVAKPEPVVEKPVAKPAEPVKPLFAWWERNKANELIVPEDKEKPVENPKLYTRAFCEKSGPLKIEFTGRQAGDPEKLDTGMPLDIEVNGDDMGGLKFKVTEGTYKDSERICLIVDESFAKDVTQIELKSGEVDCTPEQKKVAAPMLKGAKTCRQQAVGADVISYELESKDNSGVALIFPGSKIFVELGDPEGEYGAGVMDLVVVLKRADGTYLAVTCNMSHESITTSLNVVGKSALEEQASILYYNAAGG